jgi:DNA-binding NarL/FixJ family response regulator
MDDHICTTNGDMPTACRILVSDERRLTNELLVGVLGQSGFEVVFCEDALDNFVGTLKSFVPEIVVISENSAGGRAIQLLRAARAVVPAVRTVVLLDVCQEGFVVDLFRAGVKGVVSLEEPVETLIKCLQVVSAGEIWASANHMQQIIKGLATEDDDVIEITHSGGERSLSRREEQVVRGVIEGLSNRAISARLNLSEHTIKNYLFNVFEKLEVGNRAELVAFVMTRKEHRDRYKPI